MSGKPTKAERVVTAAVGITLASASGPLGAAIGAAVVDYTLQKIAQRSAKKDRIPGAKGAN